MAEPQKPPVTGNSVRLIRVFVSSPSDVADERRVLDEVVDRINRDDGRERGARLELWKWEEDAVPQIGPRPQDVVDAQMPAEYDVYLGILAHRFGTPTGRYGSGTEREFRDALRRWGRTGRPWILFYFKKAEVDPDEIDFEQYTKVREFRESVDKKGLYATYRETRGVRDGFYEQVETHLRSVLRTLTSEAAVGPAEKPRRGTKPSPPVLPRAYLQWLQRQCASVDLLGLGLKKDASCG